MTGPDDDMTAVLARTLRHHAEEAPSVDGLTEKAVAVASRRRRHRINASIAAIVVLAVGIPMAVVATVDRGGGTPAVNQAHPTWRWESYRDVQVQVPPDWTYGVPGPAWCAGRTEGETRHVRAGAVGRPGAMFAIKCASDYPPVSERENWLTFNSTTQVGVRRFDHGWVEETRRVNGVFVTVFSDDDALRDAILDSAQPIVGADQYGCTSGHPVAEDPDDYRPDAGGLPPADAVESISVCRYALDTDPVLPLLSSGRIAGEDAKNIVGAILAAPEGEGPDTSPTSEGSEIVVLRVDTVDGAREVVVRYSGGYGNGFDDGTTKHELTADAIRPLLTGANSPKSFSMAVADLLGR